MGWHTEDSAARRRLRREAAHACDEAVQVLLGHLLGAVDGEEVVVHEVLHAEPRRLALRLGKDEGGEGGTGRVDGKEGAGGGGGWGWQEAGGDGQGVSRV